MAHILKGRCSRSKLLLTHVILFAGLFLAVTGNQIAFENHEVAEPIFLSLMLLMQVVALTVSVNFGVRRLHDLGHSGWWILLGWVPLVNIGLTVMLVFLRGDSYVNEYGVPPKGLQDGFPDEDRKPFTQT